MFVVTCIITPVDVWRSSKLICFSNVWRNTFKCLSFLTISILSCENFNCDRNLIKLIDYLHDFLKELRLPGPPENLKTVKILSHSVKISWEAPLIKSDGLISYIITEQQGLFKELKQTQLETILTGLKPYTTYKVKVLSTNSYKKNESAYKILTFKTAEAGI